MFVEFFLYLFAMYIFYDSSFRFFICAVLFSEFSLLSALKNKKYD